MYLVFLTMKNKLLFFLLNFYKRTIALFLKAGANVIDLNKETNFFIKKTHLFFQHIVNYLIIKGQGFDKLTGIICPFVSKDPLEMKFNIYSDI